MNKAPYALVIGIFIGALFTLLATDPFKETKPEPIAPEALQAYVQEIADSLDAECLISYNTYNGQPDDVYCQLRDSDHRPQIYE